MKTDRKYSRKSIVDAKIYDINLLIKFVKNKDGIISFDKHKNLPGRGAYCLLDENQINILFRKKLLNKAFKQNINIEVYNNLEGEVNEWIKIVKENQM
ncbi:YlxR family protein [Mycoplasma phocoeninasale]|uniref:YlxR family protein n=2 Tax=Mycoplasma phocoeninasale TaxID=2726117 RepID=A0A858U0T5_9MOLU|nr:YlxR family protein [Mycoplasma phocoeninasale]QJG66694.1 YlxR family protein [Mycoplasma phocoeninasale]